MRFGVAMFPSYDAIPPGDLARLVEERGQESLFFPGAHPYPGRSRGRAERAAAARPLRADPGPARRGHRGGDATSRLRVGSGVGLVIQRDLDARETAIAEFTGG